MGVPIIGCDCEICTSNDPKNKRRRASIFVEIDGINLLMDTSPDLREQALANNITRVDAILYTHEHADHINGLDDLRRFSVLQEQKMEIYSNKETMDSLKTRFSHAFGEILPEWGWYKLQLNPHEITEGKKFQINGVEILPFSQTHGKYTSIGYRIGNFAYSTDVNEFNDEELEKYFSDLDLWVVDCQGYSDSKTHSKVETTLGWLEKVKPKRAVLTHMGHEIDYKKFAAELPEGVEPAYDSMVIEL